MPEFQELGLNLVAISPQMETYSRQLVRDKHLSIGLLSDPGNVVAKQFGLVYTLPEDLRAIYLKFGIDLLQFNGDDSWTLPIPARYVVDQAGTIRYLRADPDYTTRPDPEETLAAVRELFQ